MTCLALGHAPPLTHGPMKNKHFDIWDTWLGVATSCCYDPRVCFDPVDDFSLIVFLISMLKNIDLSHLKSKID